MAVLEKPDQPSGSYNLFRDEIKDDVASAGQFVAKCIDVRDAYGITQKKFNSEETEVVDVTAFLFSFKDEAGHNNLIASRSMKISGHEKSALFGFLKSWLGKAPAYGMDTMAMKGQFALLTVEHVDSKRTPGRSFPTIANISPVPKAMLSLVDPSIDQPTPSSAAKPAGKSTKSKSTNEVPF